MTTHLYVLNSFCTLHLKLLQFPLPVIVISLCCLNIQQISALKWPMFYFVFLIRFLSHRLYINAVSLEKISLFYSTSDHCILKFFLFHSLRPRRFFSFHTYFYFSQFCCQTKTSCVDLYSYFYFK